MALVECAEPPYVIGLSLTFKGPIGDVLRFDPFFWKFVR